jgi:hypothetical protein
MNLPASGISGCAQQVRRSGSFELPCNADTAFPLFSPEGERDWVSGWDPKPVFPEKIAFVRDTIFCEGAGADEALWTIVDADSHRHRAEYVRVAPASHTAHIIVEIEPLAAERSKVLVNYTVTAFGAGAERYVESFSESAYSAKMENWQRWICTHLKKPALHR